jgi:RNA polymerase sigma-70 factor (ECF subfamily)
MENEPESVRELFDAEYPGLVRLATLITGDVAGAEDAVQEAFARAVARWPRLRSYDRPGAWVRRVTIRLAVRDRGRRRRELPSELPDPPAIDATPPDAELMDALRALPPNQRAALVLFYFERLTTEEVAEELRVRPSTARSHLHRGRAALARRLSIPEVLTDGH